MKALSIDASVLIMDEPTASLTTTESNHLFRIIRELSDKGVSIIYISHRMEEVYEISDSITVLRDGKNMGTYKKTEIRPEDVIRYMIGKDIKDNEQYAKPVSHQGKEPILTVENLEIPGVIKNISFQVYPGEIVGLSGLIGSGRTETVKAIFGMDHTASGNVTLNGKKLSLRSIHEATSRGIGYVPEERALEGFVPLMSIRQNLVSCSFDWINRLKFLADPGKEKKICTDAIAKFDIKPNMPDQLVANLSGGNQQKVVLGKWLERDLKLLMVDEPTAGVDVGAKDEIYQLIKDLTKSGAGVILVSSDITELLKLSNRILILRGGEIIQEADGGTVNEEDILSIASGISA